MKISTLTLFTLFPFFLFIQNSNAQCMADAGTSTMTVPAGGTPSNGPHIICFGDPMIILSNDDYVLTSPPAGNSPGITWNFYSCQPTIEDFQNDPCNAPGVWGPEDINDINDGLVINFLGFNHFWIAPVTYDDSDGATVTFDVDGDLCWDVNLNFAYEIYYLNEILYATNVDNCLGEVTITITGGYPEFFSSTYSITNTGSGTLTQSGPSMEIVTISGLNDGDSYSFDLTDDGNGCTSSFAGGPISLNQDDPTFSFTDFCVGDTNGPSGVAQPGGTYIFNPFPGDGAAINPSTGFISNEVGGTTYTVEYTTNGVCPQSSTVDVSVFNTPSAPTVNPSTITLCPGDATIITPSGGGTTFNFYDATPPGTPLFSGTAFDPAAFLTPGVTSTFYVTEIIGSCESPATTVDITLLDLAAPDLVPDNMTVCDGASVTITPTDNNGEPSPVFNYYDDAGLNTLLSSGSDYTFTANNSTQIWVTEEVSGCDSPSVIYTLTVDPTPAAPAVSDENICLNENVPDINASGSGGSFNWYDANPDIGSPAAIATNNPFSPPVNSGVSGVTTFWVTETNGTGCESTATAFTITVEASPSAPTSSNPPVICIGDAVPQLTATGTGAMLNWYDVDPSAGSPVPIASGSPFTPSINSNITGNFDFWVTEINANNCESAPTQVTITINDSPTAPGISDPDVICLNTAAPALTATGAGGTINWYDSDPTNGSPVSIGTGSPFTPPVNTSMPGTTTYWVTETNGAGCVSQVAIVVVTVNDLPSPPTTNPLIEICVDDSAPSLTATGAGGTINWYNTDPSIGNPVPVGSGSPFTPVINTSSFGSVFFWVTESDVAGCEGAASVVNVIINPLPTLVDVQTSCAADLQSYSVDVTFANADNISVSEGTVTNNGGGSFTISGVNINNDLIVTASDQTTGCSSDFIVSAPNCNCPNINAPISDGDILICVGDVIPALTVTVEAGETVDWYDAVIGGNLVLSGSDSYVPATAGTYYAETVNIASGCTSDNRTPVTLVVVPLPSIVDFQTTCSADLLTYSIELTVSNADNISASEGDEINNGGGSFTISNIDINNNISVLASDASTGCFDSFDFNAPDCGCPVLVAPVNSGDMIICEGATLPELSVTVTAGQTVDWYDAATGGMLLLADSPAFTPTAAGIYYAETREINSGCIGLTRTEVSLTINPLPILTDSQEDCAADLLTYTTTVTFSDADTIIISEGTVVENGGGSFTISGIDINNDLVITANNAVTTCSDDFIITPPACNCPNINAPVNDGDVTICEGATLPELSVTVTAGQTVDWYDAATGGMLLLADSPTFTPTAAGIYYAETREINSGCISLTRTGVSLTINPLPALIDSQENCAADLLTYTTTVTFSDADTIMVSEGTVVENGGGSFTISSIDINNNLMITANNSVTTCSDDFIFMAPDCPCPAVFPPVSGGDLAICQGESIPILTVTVGAGETVDWYDAASGGTLLLADSPSYTPVMAGTYFAASRTLINNCTSTIRTAVTLTINELPSLSVITAIDPGCGLSDGSITLQGNGGQEPYFYQINNEGFQNSAIFSDLSADNFTFTIQDDNGCSEILNGALNAPLGVTAVANVSDTLTCATALVIIDGNQTTSDEVVMYEWIYNGEIIATEITADISEPGMYILNTYQDACMDSDTVLVMQNLSPDLTAILQSETQLDCNITSVTLDGSSSSTGQNIAFQWSLNGNLIPGAVNNTFDAMVEGMYSLMVTDISTGCSVSDDLNLINNENYPVANAGQDGTLNCVIESVLADGTNSQSGPTIIYQWLDNSGSPIPGATSPELTLTMAGTYTLMVQDTANGCANEDTMVILSDYTTPIAEAGENMQLDCNETSLVLNGQGSSVGPQFTYLWSADSLGVNMILTGENTLSPIIEGEGNYYLAVTNEINGCVASDFTFVNQVNTISTDFILTAEDVRCFEEANGFINITPENSDLEILFSINGQPFTSGGQFANLSAGTYNILAEDVNGCRWDTIIIIQQGIEMKVDLGEDLFIHLGDSAQLMPLINFSEDSIGVINWTNPEFLLCQQCLNPITVPLVNTTTFQVEISDNNGCSAMDDLTVFVNKSRQVFIPNVFSPNGDGNNDLFMIYSGNDVVQVKNFFVFDRWGEVIFEVFNFNTNNPVYGWNGDFHGRPLNAGLYVYVAEIEFKDGQTEIFSGDMMLMR